ncbi:MAG: oligosaccharide flippase family protein [Bacteroidales bacterium]|nr:oligosaccharide flippase family protein [Bacteroidales bacterium]
MINKILKPGEFGRVLMRYASAQIVSNLIRIVSGFLVVRLMDPELYGQFTGIGVYLGYILLGHGGILNGLNRELPYELGRGNDEYSRELASSVYVLSVFISILAAIVYLVFGIKNLLFGDYLTGIIFVAYTFIGGLHLLNKQFLPALYRTNKDFDSLARQNIFIGLGNILTVLLVWWLGIHGLIIRGLILAFYEFILLFRNKPYNLDFKYKTSHFIKLLKTGLPIFLVWQVNSLWATILNNIIFSVGGALNFGLYALSHIIRGAIGVIPSAFGQVIYPRMSIMLGEGKSISQILNANIKPLFFQFGVILVTAITGVLLLPVIIPLLLPKYVDGILAAQWMIFVPVIESFSALNSIYNVVKKLTLLFIAFITGAAIGSLFILLQVKSHGFYLEVFPQGLLIGKGVQQILALLFIKKIRY